MSLAAICTPGCQNIIQKVLVGMMEKKEKAGDRLSRTDKAETNFKMASVECGEASERSMPTLCTKTTTLDLDRVYLLPMNSGTSRSQNATSTLHFRSPSPSRAHTPHSYTQNPSGSTPPKTTPIYQTLLLHAFTQNYTQPTPQPHQRPPRKESPARRLPSSQRS